MLPSGDVFEASVESLSHDGRGVARVDGKVVFIDGALPGEQVRFRRKRRRRHFDIGHLLQVQAPSPLRVHPRCVYFGTCGGCALQHMSPDAQRESKQRILLESLRRIGNVIPEQVLAPLSAPVWGYRRKARVGVRLVPKKGGVLVGFREKRSSYVTPIDHCDVLHPRVSELLPDLRLLISKMSCAERIPQVEVAVGDNAIALVLRHLVPFVADDIELQEDFAQRNGIRLYLQPGNLDSVYCLWPRETPTDLCYRVLRGSIRLEFKPTDFIQVNDSLNEQLVTKVVDLLGPSWGDRVLDLFCGLGNFSLALASKGAEVLGVEGDAGLVARAQHNASLNGLASVRFVQSDLYAEELQASWLQSHYDKALLDPPRSGAMEMVKRMAKLNPKRVVYVSCNPTTLARDSTVMVHKHGYRLRYAGIVDMFPHTHHVESIAVFDRGDGFGDSDNG